MYAGRVACCPRVTVIEYADGKDGLTPDRYITLSARRSQPKKRNVKKVPLLSEFISTISLTCEKYVAMSHKTKPLYSYPTVAMCCGRFSAFRRQTRYSNKIVKNPATRKRVATLPCDVLCHSLRGDYNQWHGFKLSA